MNANRWMVCENGRSDSFCVYRYDTAGKLRSGQHLRCILHRALLRYEPAYDGLPRKEVREREAAHG